MKKTAREKSLIFILSLLLAFSLLFIAVFLYQKSEENRVTRVVDGDSFDTIGGRRIRLLSLDAPEIGRCHAEESKDYLKSLILGKKVYLKDTVIDDYGRILANVFTGKLFVNKLVLENGNARFTYNRSLYYEKLKSALETAKRLKLGIFSPVCRTAGNPDCNIKGNINHGEKFYFTPDCGNYADVIIDESFGERWFCSESDAQLEGFQKPSKC